MNFEVIKCTPEKWANYSKYAHRAVFGETRDPQLDRISYAMLVHNNDRPIGFTTCREIDRESLYWQYGGCFDGNKGIPAVRAFEAVFNDSKQKYKRISTLVKNDNVNYLHMLMKFGFRAIGIRVFGNEIFLEMFWGEQ
jgi:hypothetical protein